MIDVLAGESSTKAEEMPIYATSTSLIANQEEPPSAELEDQSLMAGPEECTLIADPDEFLNLNRGELLTTTEEMSTISFQQETPRYRAGE